MGGVVYRRQRMKSAQIKKLISPKKVRKHEKTKTKIGSDTLIPVPKLDISFKFDTVYQKRDIVFFKMHQCGLCSVSVPHDLMDLIKQGSIVGVFNFRSITG